MTFPDFEKLTPQEQLDVLEKANPMECPFWMERLKTAVEKRSPQCLMFAFKGYDKYSIEDIYWNLIELIKLKN